MNFEQWWALTHWEQEQYAREVRMHPADLDREAERQEARERLLAEMVAEDCERRHRLVSTTPQETTPWS